MAAKEQFHTLVAPDIKAWIKQHGYKYEQIVRMGVLHARDAPQLMSRIGTQEQNIKKMQTIISKQGTKIEELKERIK